MHEAAWKGYSRCVKILCNVYPKDIDDNCNKEKLNKKKQSFINRANFAGFTALHLAAQNGHNQSTRELLYASCSTTVQNDYGDTPLHTAIRYGHAGVVRILISAKCDIDAFNHNHDTPMHISAAVGRRKLTKLLIEAGAMQFRNNQNETPRDIAKRKNFQEILEIIDSQPDKIDKKLIRESLRKSKTSANRCLPVKSSESHEILKSPYGCHYYPDILKFPSPRLQTLPKEPLKTGEIYYLDLGGNIRKGPIGINRCSCAPYSKEAMIEHCRNIQKYVDKANDKLNKKIIALTTKIEKTERKHHKRERSREKDPLYPLLKIVGDKNKQIHLEKWLNRVDPEAGSEFQSVQDTEIITKEIPVDVHRPATPDSNKHFRDGIKVLRNSSRKNDTFEDKSQHTLDIEDDDCYTDISGDYDDYDESSNDNPLYDEAFLRNFQQQQLEQNSFQRNDSLTSHSINSNQNIEHEMEKIAKSLMASDEGVQMINSRKPDVINDHISISHSAKRSTKKIKSAITKPTSVLSSGDIYVNTFFKNDSSDGNKNRCNSQSSDEVDYSCEIDRLVTKVHETILSSNCEQANEHVSQQHVVIGNGKEHRPLWNLEGRSRNPIAFGIDLADDIDSFAGNIFKNQIEDDLTSANNSDYKTVQSNIRDNNFILLDKMLKARQQRGATDENGNSNEENYIPSSSLV